MNRGIVFGSRNSACENPVPARSCRGHRRRAHQCRGAEEGEAKAILKAMTDYVSRQENLSLKYDSDIEVVTPAVEKIQFSASGDVTLSRPNKFRISRAGGYADIELVSDGSSVTIHDRGGNRFAQVPGGGAFDEVVDRLRSDASLELPGADLLLSKSYEELMAGVLEAKHIGRGVVEGVECEHLAFRISNRLADLGRSRREAGAAQICHHKQGGWCRAPVHAAAPGLENRCRAGAGRVCVQTAGRLHRRLDHCAR